MSKAYIAAVRLLARREHGAYELRTKLVKQAFSSADIDEAIAECQRLHLQCDKRFAESLSRVRIRQGYGPVKIRQDLQLVRIATECIDEVLFQQHHDWQAHAFDVWLKKYKEADHTFAAQQKQKQFLLYRGFDNDTIRMLFKALKHNPYREDVLHEQF
jgi:regulatory protein